MLICQILMFPTLVGQNDTLCRMDRSRYSLNSMRVQLPKIKRWQENGIPRFEVQFEEGAVNLSSKINDFEDFNISTFKGKALKWHSNGQKEQEFTVKDGNVSGISTMWHENGQKMGEVNYIQGEKHGKHITWYENGQKHWEQNFAKNVADGGFQRMV